MATQSTDDQNKTPGQELGLGKNEDPQVARTEDAKVSSSGSPFVNSEPIREDQVQNAMKFLSHPKVRGSPVMYRRSFLEKKGLTKEEIDETFRRVPDPSPDAQAPNNNHDTKLGFPSNTQPAALPVAAPSGVLSTIDTRKQYRFHWSHLIFALATCSAGTVILIKKMVIPRLKSWIRKIVKEEENGLQPSLAEETAAAAKAAAAAAADAARVSHELLDSKFQVSSFCAELRNMLNFQLQEMKAMTGALSSLQGQANTSDTATSFTNSLKQQQQQQQPYANGKTDSYTRTASAEPSAAPHPPSYMEILSMVQRGEKPPNVKDIDDSPPNPNQQISYPRLSPRMKPWEVGSTQKTSNPMHNTQGNGNGFYSQPQVDTSIPWWQQKNSRVVQQVEANGEEQSNVTQKSLPSLEQPVQRRWVPPQPPPVVMPEAAEAIKRLKPLANKVEGGLVADKQLVLPSSDAPDSSNSAIISSEELRFVADNQLVLPSSDAPDSSNPAIISSELEVLRLVADKQLVLPSSDAPDSSNSAIISSEEPRLVADKQLVLPSSDAPDSSNSAIISSEEPRLVADKQLVLPSSDAPDSSNSAIISSEVLSSNGVANKELISNEIQGDDELTRAPEGLEA